MLILRAREMGRHSAVELIVVALRRIVDASTTSKSRPSCRAFPSHSNHQTFIIAVVIAVVSRRIPC